MKVIYVSNVDVLKFYNELKHLGFKDNQFGFTTKVPYQLVIYDESILKDSKVKELLNKYNIVI